jgi:hypothetical protein
MVDGRKRPGTNAAANNNGNEVIFPFQSATQITLANRKVSNAEM